MPQVKSFPYLEVYELWKHYPSRTRRYWAVLFLSFDDRVGEGFDSEQERQQYIDTELTPLMQWRQMRMF